MDDHKPRRMLFIKTGAIGDVLMTTPAVRLARDAFGDAHIAYLVGRHSASVLANNPCVDEVIVFDDDILLKRKYLKFLGLTALVRGKRFDTVIAFHVNRFMHLFSYMLGASRRAAFSRDGGRYLTHALDISGKETMRPAELDMELLSTLGVTARPCPMEYFISAAERRYARAFKDKYLAGGQPVVGLFPGGGKNPAAEFTHKRWGIENFNRLALRIMEEYPGCSILVFGSAAERDLSSRLIRHPSVFDLIGRTTLRGAVSLMNILDLAVTNDSSSLHFGTALNIPTVSLFGPTSHRKYAREGRLQKALTAGLPCSPCEDVRGRFVSGCKDNACMAAISPEAVFEACAGLLGSPKAAGAAVEAAR